MVQLQARLVAANEDKLELEGQVTALSEEREVLEAQLVAAEAHKGTLGEEMERVFTALRRRVMDSAEAQRVAEVQMRDAIERAAKSPLGRQGRLLEEARAEVVTLKAKIAGLNAQLDVAREQTSSKVLQVACLQALESTSPLVHD